MSITTRKQGDAHSWAVADKAGRHLGGGYAATERDALNDAEIFISGQKAPITNHPTCPLCGEPARLSLIRSSDGREWINCACRPCGTAMGPNDKWVTYLGGVTQGTKP